jgi:phospholipid transport system substrate-binding protein
LQIRHSTTLLVLLTLVLSIDVPAYAAAGRPPRQVVENLHEALLDCMKRAEELGYQGRFDQLKPAVQEAFDQPFMAEKSIGLRWKKLDEANRERWVASFSRLTVANYAGRFKGHTGEVFETLGEESAPRETWMVQTKIVVPNDDDVELNYRLRETDAGWKIIDVYMNGTVSELSLRRSEYSSTLKRKGFESLVAAVDEKATSLASGSERTAKIGEQDKPAP